MFPIITVPDSTAHLQTLIRGVLGIQVQHIKKGCCEMFTKYIFIILKDTKICQTICGPQSTPQCDEIPALGL